MAATQHRSIRIPDEVWTEAIDVAGQRGTSAGELCRQFLEWYLRRPGAELPKRPPVLATSWETYVPLANALWDLAPGYSIQEMLGVSDSVWAKIVRAVLSDRHAAE